MLRVSSSPLAAPLARAAGAQAGLQAANGAKELTSLDASHTQRLAAGIDGQAAEARRWLSASALVKKPVTEGQEAAGTLFESPSGALHTPDAATEVPVPQYEAPTGEVRRAQEPGFASPHERHLYPPAAAAELDFSDYRAGHRHKYAIELARTLAVFSACGVPGLVHHAESLLAALRATFGGKVHDALVKHTMFAQFCAGEDAAAVKETMARLALRGQGCILDYAAEADVEPSPCGSAYPLNVEADADAAVDVFKNAIDVAACAPIGSRFVALKPTALANPALLERASSAHRALATFLERIAPAETPALLTRRAFIDAWCREFDVMPPTADALYSSVARMHGEGRDGVPITAFLSTLRLADITEMVGTCREYGPLAEAALSADELALLETAYARMDAVATAAVDAGVKLLVDAEATLIQPAIDDLAIRLMAQHNRGSNVTVFHTYQCYLKDALPRLHTDRARAAAEGWALGAKLVRGAYLEQENERAAAAGRASPIHDSIEDTHAAYDAAAALVLRDAAAGRAEAVIATHNPESLRKAMARAAAMGLDSGAQEGVAPRVAYAQLLGMGDHLSESLAASGAHVLKYAPYGAVGEVMPYLLRRARENAGMLSGLEKERSALLAELGARVWG